MGKYKIDRDIVIEKLTENRNEIGRYEIERDSVGEKFLIYFN